MNYKYLKDKVFGELDASYDYIKRSIDALKVCPEWSVIFKAMSDDRYRHAVELYKMFMHLYKETKEQDTYMNSIRDAIIENFASQTQKIESYKATYDLVTNSEEMSDERNTTIPVDS